MDRAAERRDLRRAHRARHLSSVYVFKVVSLNGDKHEGANAASHLAEKWCDCSVWCGRLRLERYSRRRNLTKQISSVFYEGYQRQRIAEYLLQDQWRNDRQNRH